MDMLREPKCEETAMVATILDPGLEQQLIEERRAAGADRYDEVWEGVYVMAPIANDEHQDFVANWTAVLTITVQWAGTGLVRPGVNVSDRVDDWKSNYRCPDVVVYLNDTAAENHGEFWYGGPDFAIEITSPYDKTRDKFDFYAKVNTRELLIVDRDPWALELFRLMDGELRLVGKSTPESAVVLRSEIVPLSFCLKTGTQRPTIEVRHADGGQNWTI
jgi:Uma2 family endonuclease